MMKSAVIFPVPDLENLPLNERILAATRNGNSEYLNKLES